MLLLGWLGVMRLTHILGFPSPLGFIFCLLLLANPSFRHSVFWGIHDETYAIGIIPWIYVAWKQKRYVWTLILAFICCLMKETMFLFTAMFLVMIAWEAEFGGSPQALASRRRLQLSCVFLALVCIGCFGSYIFLQPLLFGRPFDHLSKVTSLDSFLSAEYLTSKGLWLAYLFLPFVYAPFWKVRYWHFLLPAAPFVGFVMISSFAEMHKLNNYYAVIPSLLVFLASLLILGEQQKEQGTWHIRPTAVLFLVALSFSFATGKPTREIFLQAWTKKALSPRPLEVIPPSSKVLATPSAALFLFRDRQVYIVEGAYEKFIPFEYIVTQTKELENLDPRLLQNVRKCMESEGWTIWCGGDSQLLARSGGQI
jgi:uncharacterized membrane protein